MTGQQDDKIIQKDNMGFLLFFLTDIYSISSIGWTIKRFEENGLMQSRLADRGVIISETYIHQRHI